MRIKDLQGASDVTLEVAVVTSGHQAELESGVVCVGQLAGPVRIHVHVLKPVRAAAAMMLGSLLGLASGAAAETSPEDFACLTHSQKDRVIDTQWRKWVGDLIFVGKNSCTTKSWWAEFVVALVCGLLLLAALFRVWCCLRKAQVALLSTRAELKQALLECDTTLPAVEEAAPK